MSAPGAVTAIVLARDEARHLPGCLASLQWADAVIVLDSCSQDDTGRIARERGAEVHVHPFENFSRQRQHALALATTPWVLFVDADERVPPALAAEVRRCAEAGSAAGYWIPRRNHFWGRQVRGAGWWPDYQLRLLRVGCARYDPTRAVHEVAEVDGPTARLSEPLVHLNYDSWAEFRTKQTTYAHLEARRRRDQGERPALRHLLLQPTRELYRRAVTLGGWREGGLGLLLSGLMAWYELRTLLELRRLAPIPPDPSS
jgi:hypothetical protein